MENNVNFDELAQKFFAVPGVEPYCNLFGAVFELEQWHFIAVGEPPILSPYCAIFPGFLEDQPTVLAFTDTEKLKKYVKSKNLKFGSADKPFVITSPQATVTFSSEDLILSVPTTSVVNYLERLMTEKGVKWIVFNLDKDSTEFHVELARLREAKELVNSKKPKLKAESKAEQANEFTAQTDFDALNRKSTASGGAKEDLNNLFGATFALEKWLFIARGEMPNVTPYIAANAGYADGQQMIRAFTDSERLARFAKENNLTDANGKAQMLGIPVGDIVEYLEKFIAYGAHGVWFNSDTQSGGYFIPLKQLRPIKEHLANIGWKSVNEPTNPDLPHKSGFVPPITRQKPPMEIVVAIVRDGLMLPSGVYSAPDYACNLYCLMPREWTENGKLKDAYLERLYEKTYGVTWRAGNDDGSRYVVDHSFTNVLTPEDSQGADWTTLKDDEKNHYFFFVAADNGEIRSVKPPEFQQEFVASRQTPTSSQPPPTSNLENFGLSNSPEGEPDLLIRLFKEGNVKFGSSIEPVLAAIQPLLRDYQGSGDFKFIFTFVPEAMKNLTENFPGNDHGKYFRVRKFQYHPPEGKAVSNIQAIDSNELRHIQTGATLSMSFALVQLLEDSAASLYFGFMGGSIEVKKLLKAVTPALEAAGFVDEQTKNNSPAQPAASDDKNAADYINWFRRGTVKPDTSFKPFFQAIVPLLADYAGAGEFEFSFASGGDEPGMRDLFEDVSSNSHGAYLKYRSYIFEPYEMQMIGSNRLTNVQTGEKLRIQLTMHKNLAEGKTTLIVVFVGRSATVEALENAVKSALEAAEYKVQLKLKKAADTETLQSIGVRG